MSTVNRGTPTTQKLESERQNTNKKRTPGVDRWSPVSQLELPAPVDGYRFRYVRETVNGVFDARNMTMSAREGYEFVRVDEAADLNILVDTDTKGDGLARYGGLVLAKIPEEFCVDRAAHYANRTKEGVEAANRLQGVSGPLPTSYEDRGSGVVRNVGNEAAGAMNGTNKEKW